MAIPRPGGPAFVADGGIETDLIFNRGFDLPEFAAFTLLDNESGRAALEDYYRGYAEVAAKAGANLLLATPTWRANPDWGARLGYSPDAVDRINRDAVELLRGLGRSAGEHAVVSGVVGPRGDGYVVSDRYDVPGITDYHRPQAESFAQAGADLVDAITMTTVEEAIGVVRAAASVGLPAAVSFTVETDGRLPDGTTLAAAIRRVDDVGEVAYFGVNCAHPRHIARALTDRDGDWAARVAQIRPNASTKTHAELDEADTLDRGDLGLLVASMRELRDQLPQVCVIGGCCGTDASHVAALWDVD